MLVRTVKIKLNPTTSQKENLQETLTTCNKALNWISEIAWERKCFNRVALHHLIYYELREKFNLPSQIAIALKDKVCASYKADRSKKHNFKSGILPLNFPRTAKLTAENIISFSTLQGRQRIFMTFGEFQLQYLRDKSWQIRESEVVYSNRNYYLHLTVQKESPEEINPDGVLGIDRGIGNITTLSTGDKMSGKKVRKTREKYQRLRSELQAKGTKSAKRHLKKLSGRERRFQRDVNHYISKRIVSIAKQLNWAIALEDLKGIKKRGKGKKFNGILGRWATHQLETFVRYKAETEGIPQYLTNPRNSSIECCECHHVDKQNRRGETFYCRGCGFFTNADRNASRIHSHRASVKKPVAVAGDLITQVAS